MPDCDNIPQRIVLDRTINQHGHELIEFLNESKFCCLNGRFDQNLDNYTSISAREKAIVDYICVPQDVLNSCKNFKVITAQSLIDSHGLHYLIGGRSRVPDHSVLVFELETGDNCSHTTNISETHTERRYNLRKIPVDFMGSELTRAALLNLISQIEISREPQTEIDIIYDRLCEIIIHEMSAKIPKYNSTSRTAKRFKSKKPFWNDHLQSLWNIMRQKENEFLKCHENRQIKLARRMEYVSARNSFNKELRNCERLYRLSMAVDIENMSSNNPNEFWRKIKNLGPRRHKDIPIEIVDSEGMVSRDEQTVFEKWRADFENLYNCQDNNHFDEIHYNQAKLHKQLLELNIADPLYSSYSHINSDISIEEICYVVHKAKSGSASGYDEIPYDVLKYPNVIVVLKELFQLIFDCSIIPTIWRKAIICPILKDAQSDTRIPMNYRGISLLSCIGKLYSAFLNKRLSSYLEDQDVLADEQNGFRANRSCEEHVFTLNSVIRNNKTVFTAYIDLKRCFDYIDRDMLLYKLLLNKIDGKMYNSIKNIYASSVSSVRINNKMTSWFDCRTGVKQGCTLSTTLFSIFANDVAAEINDLDIGIPIGDTKLSLLMYADDIVLMADSEEKLQTMLDTIHNWCKRWRVLINTDKSKCMHFRKGRTERSNFKFMIGNNELETVSLYKYLGIIFHEKSDFSHSCEALSKGAGRALGSLINKIHGYKEFGFKSFEKLYTSCVIPILDYCASVWGYRHYQQADNIQNRAMRYFLGVHRFTPILAMVGDTGWVPCMYRRWACMIRLWNRFNKMDQNRLTYKVFRYDVEKCDNNWSSDLKSVMTDLGLNDHFVNRTTVNIRTVLSVIRNHYSVKWARDIQNVAKLRTYRLYKTDFETEKYLCLNLNKNERSMLAQFRTGILPLRVETGRYIGEPLANRLCRLCDSQSVETEMHFLLFCAQYNDIRNTVFDNLITDSHYLDLSNVGKLKYLLNYHTRKVSTFIVKAYLRRRSVLYS